MRTAITLTLLAIAAWTASAHAQAAQPRRGRVACQRDGAGMPNLPGATNEQEAAIRTGGLAAIRATAERHARDMSPQLAVCALHAAKDRVGIESGGDTNHPSYRLATVALDYLRSIDSRPVWEMRVNDNRTAAERKTQLQRRREARAARRARSAPPARMAAMTPPAPIVWPTGAVQCPARGQIERIAGKVSNKLIGDGDMAVVRRELESVMQGEQRVHRRTLSATDVVCAAQFLTSQGGYLEQRAREFLQSLGVAPVLR